MEKDGPAYIRMGRKDEPLLEVPPYEFTIGKAATLRQGSDLTLIATGLMVKEALEAANILAARSIETRVLNMHTVKPLDEEAIRQAARETGGILTIEEHNLWGGMGESIAAIAAEECRVPVRRIGIPDEFAMIGQQRDLWDRYGLTATGIAASGEKMLGA
jgi:transketolase